MKMVVLTKLQTTIVDLNNFDILFIFRAMPEPQTELHIHPMFDFENFPFVLFSNSECESGIEIGSINNKIAGLPIEMKSKYQLY